MPLTSGGPPNSSSMQNRVHCGVNSVPPEKMPVMPAFTKTAAAFFKRQAQCLDQLRRAEHALHFVSCAENRERLIDAVLLVRFELLHPAFLDELDDPARIEVDAEADAAAVLGQMLDGQPQASRPRGPKHQPIRPMREILLGQRVAEKRIVGPEIFDSRCGSSARRWCRPFRRRRSACRPALWAPTAGPGRRAAIRLQMAETFLDRQTTGFP